MPTNLTAPTSAATPLAAFVKRYANPGLRPGHDQKQVQEALLEMNMEREHLPTTEQIVTCAQQVATALFFNNCSIARSASRSVEWQTLYNLLGQKSAPDERVIGVAAARLCSALLELRAREFADNPPLGLINIAFDGEFCCDVCGSGVMFYFVLIILFYFISFYFILFYFILF